MAEEKLLDFPWLLFSTLLLSALHLVIHAGISFALVIKLSEFIFDSIEIDMSCKHKFVLFVQLLINLLQLLLKLLNVFLCVRIHLLKHLLSPLECFNLVTRPVGGSGLQFDLSLYYIELFLEFFELSVVNLHAS